MSVPFNRSTLLQVFFIIVIGTIVYANSMNVPFFFDDIPNIQNEALRMEHVSFDEILRAVTGAAIHTRPVSNLSFALNYYLGGYKVQGYHVINISIHLLAGMFLFLLLRITLALPVNRKKYGTFHQELAFFAALLWVVHPLATQSVTYLVQRMNSMAAMFYVLALLLYVLGRCRKLDFEQSQSSGLRYWLFFLASGVSGLLAMGSKEIAVTLPVVIFMYEWYFFQDLQLHWVRKKISLLVATFLFIGIVAYFYVGKYPWQIIFSDCPGRDFTAFERLLTQFRVVVQYISLLLYPNPDRLALDYSFPFSTSLINPVTTLYSFIGILSLIFLAIMIARRERLLSFCIFWFFTNLVVESSVICLEIIFEHRTYLPSMLLLFIPVAMFGRVIRSKLLFLIFFLPVIVCFSFWTVERNRVWQDPLLFWEDNMLKQPGKARPHNNYGLELNKLGHVDSAEQEFRTSISLKPTAPYPQINLGKLLWKTGRLQEAEKFFRAAINSDVTYIKAYLDLAHLMYETDRNDEALGLVEEGYLLDPDNLRLNKLRGQLLLRIGKPKEALKYLNKALASKEKDSEVLLSKGEAFQRNGDLNNAIKAYEEALKYDKRSLAAQYNLAMLHQEKNDIEMAMLYFRRAAKLESPVDVPIKYNYGNLLQRQRRLDEAMKMYEKFLSSEKYFVDAHNNLGLVYLQQEDLLRAMEQFEMALRINPEHPSAKENMVILQSMMKSDERGKKTQPLE